MTFTSDLGIYIHWPFCEKKCPYCDFNSHVRDNIDYSQWLNAYLNELRYHADSTPERSINSIFFGGGTPSLIKPFIIEKIVDEICRLWHISKDIEITLEANPSSSETQVFRGFRGAGINRVSIGVQSLNNRSLKFLGRLHNASEAKKAVVAATKIFSQVSFDLIYALPEQSHLVWKKELNEAISLAAGHLSLYQLTIEPGTEFSKNRVKCQNEDDGATLYGLTQEIADKANLPAYEISNHAQKGQESRHNLAYWKSGDYLGIGPGAHGRVTNNFETTIMHNFREPEKWIDLAIKKHSGQQKQLVLDPKERRDEIILMGLRLTEGVSLSRFYSLTGQHLFEMINQEKFDRLSNEGLLCISNQYLKTTPAGRLRLNAIIAYLLT